MRKLFTVLVLAFLFCRPAHSEMMTAQEYLRQPQTGPGHDAIVLLLSGMEAGMYLASVYYERDGFPRLYCPPEHLVLAGEKITAILNEFLKSNERVSLDTSINVALLFALRREFPCPPK
jgi:hypothetical protein